jgi:hypothetical protein
MTEEWGFNSQQGQEIFLFFAASRLALLPTQSPFQWELGAVSMGVEQQEHETDHSHISSAEVNNGGALPHSPISPRVMVVN